MAEWNWKTWILLFVVAMGLVFEAIKRMPTDTSKWTAENLKFSSAQTTPYQVKYNNLNRRSPPAILPPAQPKARGAGPADINRETIEKFIAANKTHTGEFNHAAEAGKDPKAKAKSKPLKPDEEWEVVVDPKTGKRYKRRKKKVAVVEAPKVETTKETPKKEEPKQDDVDAVMNEAITNGGLPPVGNGPDTPHADLEEWKRRLLARPDSAETRRFIEHYKNGLVTADIFYKIIALMLEDSRPQMKELGVLCAGLTPSVLSFQVLSEVRKEERSGTSLRRYTESFLAQYSSLGNLYVLERILKAPSNAALAVEAAKRLDDSANTYLAPAKNKTPKNSAASTQHSNANYYRRFVAILQGLTRSSDAQVKEQSRITLADINNLMTLSGSPATAATATPAQASAE